VYAVQGYDAAQMLGIGLAAVKGDVSKKAEFAAAACARRASTARAASSR
jgi:branched-chain amino acid transport system substrate-binding protein